MKFSHLTSADLATTEKLEIKNAAIPAIPAIHIDSKGNSLAIPLLFSAIPLLFDGSGPTVTTKNSSKIAANSSRIANQKLLENKLKQSDTEKIAGIAKIAASESCENAKERPEYIDGIKHDTQETHKEAQALGILHRLYAEHQQRLIDGGHDGKGALVKRTDYWRALRKAHIPPETAYDLLDAGRVRVQSDGLYWIPMEAKP
jgi:hypothetical protein